MQQRHMHYAAGARTAGTARLAAGLTLDAWDRMMISSAGRAADAYRQVSPGAAEAFALIDAGFLGVGPDRGSGDRAVPSAGSIYPYECFVVSAEGSVLVAFHTDPARRTCHRLRLDGSARTLLAAAGIATPGEDEAAIVIVSRPWLSMRKYGDRGYLYTHLDTSHFATNLLGLAADRGTGGGLRLRLRRKPLADLLVIGDECREVHSVLEIRSTGRSVDLSRWVFREAGTTPTSLSGPERASWLERMCWQSLGPLVADDVLPRLPVQRKPLLPVRPDLPGGERVDVVGRWHALSAGRRSSKGFEEAAVPLGALARTLGAAGTPLAVDLPDDTALRATLVARSVAGLAPGRYEFGAGAAGVAAPPGGDEVVEACMYQDHIRHAAACVLVHVPRRELIDHPPTAIRELLFRAGALGQLLYLGATGAGVAVTGIGGFDARRWRLLAGLPDDHEVLYLVVFGRDGAERVKWDRFATAYAQNER